ncbi:MAG: helix-turn-helix domain-containing protein [Acidimicrobiales bacterium]|nr:helix-turn-helix domain-containing protein [Acidimicrobiales bacterium]MCB1015233.1 helix-turn-helix domain-containing protein [Acidimicrobiales bacterium]
MNPTTLQEQAKALGDPTRHAIFRHIAQAGRAVGIAELNDQFPFNHNAIRQHLAKLVAADLVVETTAPAAGRGRPRLVYEVNPAVGGQWGTTGPYERLSRLLIEIIRTGLDPEEVGRRAADLFRVPSPSGDIVADVTAAMARQGFEPEVRALRGAAEIALHNCPFTTTALADRDTICALHLGIAEGLTDDDPATVTELVAYDPRKAGCKLRIRLVPDDGDDDEETRGTLSLRGKAGAR